MPKGISGVLRLHDGITSAEFALATVALAVLLCSFLFEVVSRYFFGAPTRWSSDLVQYSLCVSGALAFPAVTREGGHIAITSFLEKLSASRQALASKTIVWLGAITLFGTTALFLHVATDQARQGIETVAAFAIPKWWLTSVVALGLFDGGLHLLRQAIGLSLASTGQESEL